MNKSEYTDLLKEAYVEFNGADYIFFGLVDTDGQTLKAIRLSVKEFVSWTIPDHTSKGQDSIKIRIGTKGAFEFLQLHMGRVETVGKLADMMRCPGKNQGEKFESYIIARFGWTPTPTGSAWYLMGDAIDDDGRAVQIGFDGKTVCHTGHLETLGLI